MLQILGLRPFVNQKKGGKLDTKEVYFEGSLRAVSHAELFSDYESFIKAVPAEERYNLFYTLHHVYEGSGRNFEKMTAIAFDIDGIAGFTESMTMPIAEIICSVVALPLTTASVICSGRGVHVIFDLVSELHTTDPEFFKRTRAHYKSVSQKIEIALKAAGFVGAKGDTQIWDKARILRLPGTENRKKDKETCLAALLQIGSGAVHLDITKASGIAELEPEDTLPLQSLAAYPAPDTDAVLAGCGFLKHVKENQKDVAEPEWYAALSILGRVHADHATSVKIAHDSSRLHPGYQAAETDMKIEQALLAGPRTCQSIHDTWRDSKCRSCPHWGKISSPILIQGADFIRTATTGFYAVMPDPSNPGRLKIGAPQYEDLRKFFYQKTKYFVAVDTEAVYRWADTHWEEMPDIEIRAFANDHFNPKPKNNVVNEFIGAVKRNNLRKYAWFRDSTFKKMNFENGVLDLDSMEFTEHSPKFGFRKVLPYAYTPGALAPRFTQFMQEVMQGRGELIEILLEFMGYSLSNDVCWEQKAVVLLGVGANGKSTFVNTLKKLAGEGAYSSVNIADLENPANRYHLDGAAFNISEETPTKSLADSSLFKNLVSGGEIIVKKLFVQPYMILNRAKMWLLCNEMPRTYDSSYGMFRRLVIVPFDATFAAGNQDIFIEEKLSAELPGILNLALAAYKKMRDQRGLTKSKVVQDAVQAYKLDSDICLSWWHEHVFVHSTWDPGSDIYTVQQEIYEGFRQEMEIQGERNIPSMVQFFRRINMSVETLHERRFRHRITGKGMLSVLFGVQLLKDKKDHY